jgi:hypothetical protein
METGSVFIRSFRASIPPLPAARKSSLVLSETATDILIEKSAAWSSKKERGQTKAAFFLV